MATMFIGKNIRRRVVKPINNSVKNRNYELESIANGEAPNSKVKVEKNNKGLYERTENSTILLTEDNKMLLND